MARDARCFRPPSLDKLSIRLPGQGRRMEKKIAPSLSSATGSCADQSIYRSCRRQRSRAWRRTTATKNLAGGSPSQLPLPFSFFLFYLLFFSTNLPRCRQRIEIQSLRRAPSQDPGLSWPTPACGSLATNVFAHHWCLPVRHLTHALSLISARFMI